MKKEKAGNPNEEDNLDLGPLVSEDRLNTVHEMVEEAKQEGTRVLLFGKTTRSVFSTSRH
ncbi:hypothetical protein KP78_21860 [Jeotgalibacillus soli]|uniref:Aldehyde dehydrogenase domain-containing protein n=1 Tax=Jeotgalibacillus soli TaxID=889306 RepID=A0A0C2VA42_9BACL|nr:aldehyde dehydrogenase family protein [Jeotgalibacillus soli]KIL45837.1 hypothetical protein KP78_21860 [Jeotgalibacillus soli]